MSQKRLYQNQKAVVVNSTSSHHYDWCQALTNQLDLHIFPRIIQENSEFHEITALISPRNRYDLTNNMVDLIKDIITDSPETSYSIFHEPDRNNLLFAHFLVKHEKTKTFTGFINSSVLGETYESINCSITNARSGTEHWVITGTTQSIDDTITHIQDEQLGRIFPTTVSGASLLKQQYLKEYYSILGATDKESNILSLSHLSGLMDNPYDEKLNQMVRNKLELPKNIFENILQSGIFSCSWIHGEFIKMKRECNKINKIQNES
jgi:hypothetical protein